MKMRRTMEVMVFMTMVGAAVTQLLQEDRTNRDSEQNLSDFDWNLWFGAPGFTSSSFSPQSPGRIPRHLKTILTKETRPHIQELSIRTTIISRYAITAVSCSMVNRRAAPAEALFSFQLPPEALISNFTMIIAGRVFQSKVRPRVKKVKTGVKETSGGRSPETDSQQEVDVFRMAVNIPPGNRAVFLLTYEELLRRHLGRYEHVTRLRPSQLVSRLHLEVTVVDHAPISHLEVLPLRGHSGGSRSSAKPVPPVTTQIQNQNQIWKVTFSPSIVQQAKMSTSGLLGDFIVSYGVQEAPGVGDVQVRGHGVKQHKP
ncbi:inter-alpha-trypsin inhibitor heavy chain H5-like [Cynoglossus semilaevis]|uniref:inter-alpha-trypsin inhibitor heavy chain H5-like n=1 Tax=Cynoglossus semilaevis TaxID=244447 RepID=UPI000497AE0C|nr:inter-alpha-trypsin inhibitor heavy chain H5-like [Cynoglossus semilaevis]